MNLPRLPWTPYAAPPCNSCIAPKQLWTLQAAPETLVQPPRITPPMQPLHSPVQPLAPIPVEPPASVQPHPRALHNLLQLLCSPPPAPQVAAAAQHPNRGEIPPTTVQCTSDPLQMCMGLLRRFPPVGQAGCCCVVLWAPKLGAEPSTCAAATTKQTNARGETSSQPCHAAPRAAGVCSSCMWCRSQCLHLQPSALPWIL